MNNKGNLLNMPVNLLMLFISVTFLIALIPAFVEMQNTAQGKDSLNCHGYIAYNDDGTIDYTNSANNTIATKSSIACMAIKLYIPYIVLGVLVAGVAMIFYGKTFGSGPQDTYQ